MHLKQIPDAIRNLLDPVSPLLLKTQPLTSFYERFVIFFWICKVDITNVCISNLSTWIHYTHYPNESKQKVLFL